MAVEAYADECDHFCLLLIGVRVVFPQVWHVVVMWGSLCWLMRVVELYPGISGVLHCLQMLCLMWGGSFVLVLCAILRSSVVYLRACVGSVFTVFWASWWSRCILCCGMLGFMGFSFVVFGGWKVYKTIVCYLVRVSGVGQPG